MSVYYEDDGVTVHHGDCLDVMAELPDASVDAVVCDPPYNLGFMGKQWDTFGGRSMSDATRQAQLASGAGWTKKPYGASGKAAAPAPGEALAFQQWCEQWTAECLRVLKPGGHLLAFGGTRTWHRLAVAVEDAGFEVRDSIAWLYGSGFPKSLDVSKAVDAHTLTGGKSNSRAIRKANDSREVVGTKLGQPGTSAGQKPGTQFGEAGASARGEDLDARSERLGQSLAEGGHRRDLNITAPATPAAQQWQGWGTALKPAFEPIVVARKPLIGTVAGNVLAHGTGALNVDGCRVPASDKAKWPTGHGNRGDVYAQDAASLAYRTGIDTNMGSRWPTNVVLDGDAAERLDAEVGELKSGSRKAGEHGLMGYMGADVAPMPEVIGDSGGASRFFPVFRYQAKAPTRERVKVGDVAHPTVKPLALMRWLVRLVTPPGGVVLDPFAGSGTTVEAAILEGFRVIGIEREADYLPLIEARIERARPAPTPQQSVAEALALFDFEEPA